MRWFRSRRHLSDVCGVGPDLVEREAASDYYEGKNHVEDASKGDSGEQAACDHDGRRPHTP